jgi:hypothetical protein
MNRKFRCAGAGLLVFAAMAGLTAVTASATKGGHFVTAGNSAALVRATEEGTHKLEFLVHGLEGAVICDEAKYFLQTDQETEEDLTIAPEKVENCHTTGSATDIPVKLQCSYVLYVAKGSTEQTEQTVDLDCPTPIHIQHPNCTLTIKDQKGLTGITYTKIVLAGKHAITLNANVQFNVEYHGGLCVFLGTNHTGTLKGTITVEAEKVKVVEPIDLTAT